MRPIAARCLAATAQPSSLFRRGFSASPAGATGVKLEADGKALRRWDAELATQSAVFTSLWSLGSLGLVGGATAIGFAWFEHGHLVPWALGLSVGSLASAALIGESTIRSAGRLHTQVTAAGLDLTELRQLWWTQLTARVAAVDPARDPAAFADACKDVACFQAVEEFVCRNGTNSRLTKAEAAVPPAK